MLACLCFVVLFVIPSSLIFDTFIGTRFKNDALDVAVIGSFLAVVQLHYDVFLLASRLSIRAGIVSKPTS